MTRIANVWLWAIVVTVALAMSAGAQSPQNAPSPSLGPSLGDYARTVKKDKAKAAKTFDNDNLPTQDTLSVVGGEAAAATGAQPTEAASKSDDGAAASGSTDSSKEQPKAQKMPAVQPGESQENRQKVYDQWQQQLASQKDKVDLLSRELDVMQREYKLRAAEMYGDAGSRLRNETNWDKQDADYKAKLAEKQKALDEAKAQTDELQEDARKAGVPATVMEGSDTK
jgi:hypothetical protein